MRSMFKRWRARHTVMGSSTVLSLLAIALIVGSVALAAWLMADGKSAGHAQVATLVTPTVTPGSTTPSVQLLPGQTGSMTFHAVNTNSVPVRIYGWKYTSGVGGAFDESLQPITVIGGPCGTTNFETYGSQAHFGNPANPAYVAGSGVTLGSPIVLPPGPSDFDLPNSIQLDPAAPTTCQGATLETGATSITFHFSS